MVIYKFLNEKGALATIENNSVLLKRPIDYNDPFDCDFYISDKEKQKAFKIVANYYVFKTLYDGLFIENKELILGKLNTCLLKSNLKSIVKVINKNKRYKFDPHIHLFYWMALKLSGQTDEQFKQICLEVLNEIFVKIRQNSLISCFSLKNDSILVWSHYADSHKGVCVEYEVEDKNFRKVHYSKRRKTFQLTKILEIVFGHNFLNIDMNYKDKAFLFAIEPIFIKSKDWKYEKEVRCAYSLNNLDPKIKPGKNEKGEDIWLLDMPAIKTIYIGCNASKEFVDKIKSISDEIPIIKMEKRDDEYGLKQTNLDSTD